MVNTACGYGTCDRPRENGGLCWMHYNRKRLGKDMDAPPQGKAAWREKRPAVERMIADGASINEIMRTLGVDFSTLKAHFPDYRGWGVGMPRGGPAQIAREGATLLKQRIELKGWRNG